MISVNFKVISLNSGGISVYFNVKSVISVNFEVISVISVNFKVISLNSGGISVYFKVKSVISVNF